MASSSDLPDSQDWTLVPSRRSNQHGMDPTRSEYVPPEANQLQTRYITPVPAIVQQYSKTRTSWETTSCCQALRELAQSRLANAPRVTRAICLGVGTFDPPDYGWQATRRTHIQIIAFLIIVEELEKVWGQKIECVFQDPDFSDSDKGFFASLGHEVVDHPRGCDMVTPQTFLYAIHLYKPVYAQATKNCLPAVFAGTGWETWQTTTCRPIADFENMEKMEKEYEKTTFPREKIVTTFSNTSIYWKPSAPPEEGDANGLPALLASTHIS